MSVSIVKGVTPDGRVVTLRLNPDGSLAVGSLDGTSGATAANQEEQTDLLKTIENRLISLTTYTDNLESLLASLNTYTDSLEALLAAANATSTAITDTLTPIGGFVDGIEGNQTTGIARIESIRDRLPSNLSGGGSLKVAITEGTTTVAGSVAVTNLPATQAISATSLPLPANAATETSNAAIRDRLPVALGLALAANSLPVTLSTDGAFSTNFGAIADSAATTDTGIFSHLQLFKRLLQRFTSLLVALPTSLTASGNFKVAIAESTTRTPNYLSSTTSGSVAAGAQSIAIANLGSAAGTVKGVSLPAGASISWGANASDVLSALSFDATGTTFLITTVI